jgi:PAS domain S-box-containing protein
MVQTPFVGGGKGGNAMAIERYKGKPGWHIGFAAICVLLVQIGLVFASNPSKTPIEFTHKEKAWLATHPVIRVGVDPAYAPYSFRSPDGIYQGVAVDYMTKITQMLGVRFEIVPALSWPQILAGAKNHSVDLIATAVQTPEREQFLAFTSSYIPTPLVIISRSDEENINSPEDLTGKRVALVEGYSSSQHIKKKFPDIQQYSVKTPLEGLTAVSGGLADAYVGVVGVNTYLISKHGISNLKVAAGYEMQGDGQRFAVRKDWPELVTILDKALDSISEDENLSIFRKWIPIYTSETKPQKATELLLTQAENQWLADHREMRLAVDPEFAPVEFIDEQGNYSGIAADYVELLNERLGITMRVVPGLSWSDAMEQAKRGGVDVFAAITPTVDRKKYLNFTDPYFKYPFVIFTRDDFPLIAGLESLTDKKVVVVKDYVTHELVQTNYPQVDLVTVDTIHDGLAAVSTGKADAFVGDTATASYMIRKYNFANLKIAAPTEFKSEGHCFAIRKDWPQLVSILNKALKNIPPQKRLAISKKWIEIEVAEFPRYWIWIAEGTAGLLLVFVALSSIFRIQVRRRTAELSQKNLQLEREAVERQRIEDAQRESEKRLSQFFHATFEMVFFHDNGKILDVNPAAMQTTGYQPKELIGRNILEFVSPESRQTVLDNMSTGVVAPYEIDIVTKRGTCMPVEIHARNIDLGGYKVRVVSLRDISERKRSEAALQRAHDDLELKVDERTRELVQANEKLQELDRLKSMFIASVSHELRTPLNSIIGFSGMMMQEAFGALNEKYSDYVSRINHSGRHLLALITDIIDLSKIESGRIDIIASDFSLNEMIFEAVKAMRHQAENKNLTITVDVPGEISVHTDRRRLMQCLLNFLSNAVKYSERGGIAVIAEQNSGAIKLSVRDTGIGIKEDDMHKLFEPFERIDSHLRVKAGGTGLGLYLTRKIARELLHGEVGVESSPGGGSEFWIQIPSKLPPQQRL